MLFTSEQQRNASHAVLSTACVSQIDVFVHVLVADGGVQAACVNAAMLALAHAGLCLCWPPWCI